MEEKKLVQIIIVVGVVSLCAIAVSQIVMENTANSYLIRAYPSQLCQRDYTGEYVLGRPASTETCTTIRGLAEDITDSSFCNAVKDEERRACRGLVGILGKKNDECWSIIWSGEEGEPDYADVSEYCAILQPYIEE